MVMMMWGYGMGGFGWLVMTTWWVLVAAGIVWLARSASERSEDRGSARSARQVLDERFAAGDLSIEEYHERRRTLG